jgi:hypothetical protein
MTRAEKKRGCDIMLRHQGGQQAPEWPSYAATLTPASLEKFVAYLGARLREGGSPDLDYGLFAVAVMEDIHYRRVDSGYGLAREVYEYYGVTTEA